MTAEQAIEAAKGLTFETVWAAMLKTDARLEETAKQRRRCDMFTKKTHRFKRDGLKSTIVTSICAAVVTVFTAACQSGGGGSLSGGDAAEVDLDLTPLSVTMKYAETVNIYQDPDTYVGKTIKVDGVYVPSHDETNDVYYQNVLIIDTTACCISGFEFKLDGKNTYPDDYPAVESTIEVTGVFSSYEDSGQVYYCLERAELVAL
jgi:uncharacterized membrane protein YcgQ (UPF0703/DUF1980 family)